MKNLPDNLPTNQPDKLPGKLYSVASVVRLEQIVINQFDVPAYTLMQRAAEAVYTVIKHEYSHHKKILVLCGAGNNAGDGYVVARLAKSDGFDVSVISLSDVTALKDEAAQAYQDWIKVGDLEPEDMSLLDVADLVVDALLGTGLKRDVSAEWADWITAVNRSSKPVISVDVPSGLVADTGAIAGVAIQADITVCFIGLKQGMFTAQANDVCGQVIFDDLAVPAAAYVQVDADACLLQAIDYSLLPERKPSSHKGSFGHVLIVGGNVGMPGAAILAARAALRTGAGLVTILTVPENLQAISNAVPEAMVKTCNVGTLGDIFTESFVKNITHVAIGMGLGQDEWSLALLRHCLALEKPVLIDADALNLLAQHGIGVRSSVIITPHPGEAARLLTGETSLGSIDVQRDRFVAVKRLYDMFQNAESCCVVLKGSGTLIYDGRTVKVCALGSAAMAAPGLGDVLSGIIIGLMAQHIESFEAVELAVCLHASAAESVVADKTRGLLASDVIDALPGLLR